MEWKRVQEGRDRRRYNDSYLPYGNQRNINYFMKIEFGTEGRTATEPGSKSVFNGRFAKNVAHPLV